MKKASQSTKSGSSSSQLCRRRPPRLELRLVVNSASSPRKENGTDIGCDYDYDSDTLRTPARQWSQKTALEVVLDDSYRCSQNLQALGKIEQRLLAYKMTLIENGDWNAMDELAQRLESCIRPENNKPLPFDLYSPSSRSKYHREHLKVGKDVHDHQRNAEQDQHNRKSLRTR